MTEFVGWDILENSNNGSKIKLNKKIKKDVGDKTRVFCNFDYAQDLYNLYMGKPQIDIKLQEGSTVRGKVLSVDENIAIADLSYTTDGIVNLNREDKNLINNLTPGVEVDFVIDKVDNKRNIINLSYTKGVKTTKTNELIDAINENVAYNAKVVDLIHGGYFVLIDGIKCFLPGSLAGINKIVNFEELLGQEIYVSPVNYHKTKDYIVVSHKKYLKSLIPSEIEKLKIGDKYSGVVTGTHRAGIFVEFNKCLTGLISVSDLDDEYSTKFKERKIKPGDNIEFYLKDIINKKLILTRLNIETTEKFILNQEYLAKVVNMNKFGIFVEVNNKTGLILRQDIDYNSHVSVGQSIKVKLKMIDEKSNKLFFIQI